MRKSIKSGFFTRTARKHLSYNIYVIPSDEFNKLWNTAMDNLFKKDLYESFTFYGNGLLYVIDYFKTATHNSFDKQRLIERLCKCLGSSPNRDLIEYLVNQDDYNPSQGSRYGRFWDELIRGRHGGELLAEKIRENRMKNRKAEKPKARRAVLWGFLLILPILLNYSFMSNPFHNNLNLAMDNIFAGFPTEQSVDALILGVFIYVGVWAWGYLIAAILYTFMRDVDHFPIFEGQLSIRCCLFAIWCLVTYIVFQSEFVALTMTGRYSGYVIFTLAVVFLVGKKKKNYLEGND